MQLYWKKAAKIFDVNSVNKILQKTNQIQIFYKKNVYKKMSLKSPKTLRKY